MPPLLVADEPPEPELDGLPEEALVVAALPSVPPEPPPQATPIRTTGLKHIAARRVFMPARITYRAAVEEDRPPSSPKRT
jgi:hypothetical protein